MVPHHRVGNKDLETDFGKALYRTLVELGILFGYENIVILGSTSLWIQGIRYKQPSDVDWIFIGKEGIEQYRKDRNISKYFTDVQCDLSDVDSIDIEYIKVEYLGLLVNCATISNVLLGKNYYFLRNVDKQRGEVDRVLDWIRNQSYVGNLGS